METSAPSKMEPNLDRIVDKKLHVILSFVRNHCESPSERNRLFIQRLNEAGSCYFPAHPTQLLHISPCILKGKYDCKTSADIVKSMK